MGTAYSVYKELFPAKPEWSTDQVPDLTGQVMIVTGGNAGVGKETIKVLLSRGAKVYLAARSKSKADEAIEWLKAETGGKLPVFLQLDLADLASVRRAVEEFKRQENMLDVLFNNAGVMEAPMEAKTSAGYDLQFGTNVLGHYLLTILLLPILIHTAKTRPQKHARVVNTAAGGHRFVAKGGVDYSALVPNDAASEARRRKMTAHQLYDQSKWANIVFSNELDRRYSSQGIVSTAVHPGVLKTELQRHMMLSGIRRVLFNLISWPAHYGALGLLYAGTVPEGDRFSGQYFSPWARKSEPRADTRDKELGQTLWMWLEEQAKLN